MARNRRCKKVGKKSGPANENGKPFRATGSGPDSQDGAHRHLNITYDGDIVNEIDRGAISAIGKCSGLGKRMVNHQNILVSRFPRFFN